VIVHANVDDLRSQPSGNSGGRIGCGLISKSADQWF
jgi:Cu/Zn superoxide dismutase